MTIDFGQRDLRGTELFGAVEEHFRRLHEPAFGQPSAATDPDPRPDGGAIAFTGTVFTELAGHGTARVCLAESGSVTTLTDGPGEQRYPRFSPDGSLLAYLSDAGEAGDFQLRIRDLAAGTDRAVDAVSGTVEYLQFGPDGSHILLGVAGHGADMSGGEGSGTTARADDELPDWIPTANAGPTADAWRSAWVVDVATGKARQVSADGTNVWEAAWAGPAALLVVTSPEPGEGAWYTARLYRIDLDTGSAELLFTPEQQLGWPTATASGERWAFVTATCSDRWIVAGDLHIATEAGDGVVVDTAGVDVTWAQWFDEQRLGYFGLRGLTTVAGVYDHAAGKAEEVWSAAETCGDRYPLGRFLPDGSAAVVLHGYTRYYELAFVRDGGTTTVASLRHPGADYLVSVGGTAEPVRWQAPDGWEIEGLLCVPDGPGPHPLVVHVHGGPVWAYRDRWAMGYVFTPLLVSRGYAVLHPNPRGSGGRGQDFARAVFGDMGGADTYDYLSGIDAMVERGIADPARIGVAGGSYGGFMSAWLITQDQRFAAAVPMAPSTNWYSQHHTSNIPFFDTLFLADEPRARTGKFLDRSPLLFADQVVTPTLQTTGALDRCTPPGQAVEYHNALREVGVESALAIYPREGHGVRNFPALIDQCTRIVGWFERYMPGLTGSVMAARVVVVGAGAVGLSCAYFLQRAGFEVTVLDAGPVGEGASWGNAGWITPSLSAPIPGPAALRTALGSIGKPDSPLWLRPQPDPGFALWGLSFLRHCTRASNERGLAATALLSRDAFRYYDEMRADGVTVDLERRGLLFIARSETELDAELAELGRLPAHGIDAEITRLSGPECRDRQPVIGPAVAGGIFLATEGHLDPRQLTAALATVLTSRGAVIRTGVPVADFVVRDARVTAVQADTGRDGPDGLAVDHVVIAAGALSVPVTRKLGARLPMTAGKGYSVSVGCPQLPAAPMYLVETRVGATPMAGRLRLAGTIEFSGLNSRLDRRRIDSLVHAARAYFPDLTWTDVAEEWTGMRPLCPDGLPVLDRVPGVANAYLATGHSTLGITLAAVTGAHVAEFVRTGTPPSAAAPFRFPSYAGRPR